MRTKRSTQSYKVWAIPAAVVMLLVPAGSAVLAQTESGAAHAGARDSVVRDSIVRDSVARDSAVLADSVELVARLLGANGAPAERATPAAAAIMKYARMHRVDPLLVVGIIGVENATLTPRARSGVGASGVMQVMPLWKQYIRDCGDDLRDVQVNVCFGTRILRIALNDSKTVREALLRYNGCVRAPNCQAYASAVFSRAGRAVLLARATAGAAPEMVALESRAKPAGTATGL
jgi:soluble lytic murein transglycosylase-like protein